MHGFNETQIVERLRERGYGNCSLALFDALDSTHQWLKSQLAAGAIEAPYVCAADWQQAGLATRGRTWETLAGNLTFSLYEEARRPLPELMGLSLVTGIAVAETLQQHCNLAAKVKWPNDVLIEDRKIAGILTDVMPLRRRQGRAKHDASDDVSSAACKPGDTARLNETAILCGIGINVVSDPRHESLGIGATSLQQLWAEQADEWERLNADKSISIDRPGRPLRDRLLAEMVASVLDAYRLFDDEGWDAFSARWDRLDALRDRDVYRLRHGSVGKDHNRLIARGVDERGALKLECINANGSSQFETVYSGEMSVRPVGQA